ncbi:MAG: porphobilinogen synthase [Rickettsiales bacterium]|nr:porphobilinogen synthase [Rickettsiales bacterium]
MLKPRRLRSSQAIRNLVQETRISVDDLILPIFTCDKNSASEKIKSLPDVYRLGFKELKAQIKKAERLGVNAVILFPYIEQMHKDENASHALSKNNYLLKYIAECKKTSPKTLVIADVALDPYTISGHDGLLNKKGEVDNDLTCEILAKQAVLLAEAGADIISPSDMMDGRVAVIRRALDENGFSNIPIISYTAKYASNLYTPFREAIGSDKNLKKANKKTYQMNPANCREAILEAQLDCLEGADILMVKPAIFYLDIIKELKNRFNIPIFAYQVSGEYAMLKNFAGENKELFENILLESILSIKRAGANSIITYGAIEIAEYIKNNE